MAWGELSVCAAMSCLFLRSVKMESPTVYTLHESAHRGLHIHRRAGLCSHRKPFAV
jgi:hypothetical protein